MVWVLWWTLGAQLLWIIEWGNYWQTWIVISDIGVIGGMLSDMVWWKEMILIYGVIEEMLSDMVWWKDTIVMYGVTGRNITGYDVMGGNVIRHTYNGVIGENGVWCMVWVEDSIRPYAGVFC